MSDAPEEASTHHLDDIKDISDLSATSDTDPGELISTSRSPPSRGALERETSKLRSKYRILRNALIEERVSQVEKQMADVEEGRIPGLQAQLEDLDDGRRTRLRVAHKRKQVKVETILNDYKCKVQAVHDERLAGEAELMSGAQRRVSPRRPKVPKTVPRKGDLGAIDEEDDLVGQHLARDLTEIRDGIDASKEERAATPNDTRELMHSD